MNTIFAWADSLKDAVATSLDHGSPVAYVLVFLAGVVASLTPCVYPMIPVTIAIIGGRTRKGPKEGFVLSLFYALGLAITYAVIGGGLAAARKFGGSTISQAALAQSPWVALGIGVICMLFAMVMFDKLSMPMPARVQQWQARRRGGNYLGALAAGIVFGTVASPCLAPVVGLIALQIAVTGRVLYGAAMLFTFGLGLGVIFVVIGTFSGALSSMPKAGAWMDRVKSAFGWAMIAIALGYVFHAGALQARAVIARQAPEMVTSGLPGGPPYTMRKEGAVGALPVGAGAGAPAVDCALASTGGGATSLSSLWQDKVLVLVFFADWCHNCPEEVPTANAFAALHPDKARVMGVGAAGAPAVVSAWAAQHGVKYDLIFDPDSVLLGAYHPEDPGAVPWTVVIGRDGRLLYRDVAWPRSMAELVEQGFAASPGAAGGAAESQPGAASPQSIPGEAAGPGTAPGVYDVVRDQPEIEQAAIGKRAPDLQLTDGSGGAVSLSRLWAERGLVLALVAGPGTEYTLDLASLAKLVGDSTRGPAVMVVSGAPTASEAPVWASENAAPGMTAADPTHLALKAFGGDEATAPLYAFIARDGTVKHLGPWPEDDAPKLLEALAGD